MDQKRSSKPSPAMVVAMIALFVALGGGAYASVALNQVRSVHIKNGEVKNPDLANSSVGTLKLRDRAVTSAKIKDGDIQPVDLSPAARGTVYGSYSDGAVPIDGATAEAGTVILTLSVPAGTYAIVGKAILNNDSATTATTGACRLATPTDWDEARTGLQIDSDVNDEAMVTMTVVTTYAAPGTVELRCTDFGTGTGVASWRKIVAIPFGAELNTAM